MCEKNEIGQAFSTDGTYVCVAFQFFSTDVIIVLVQICACFCTKFKL